MSARKLLLGEELLRAIVFPNDPAHASVATWFQEGQNARTDHLEPFVSVTTLSAVEADARAGGQVEAARAVREMRADFVAQKRLVDIDRSVAERFGRYLETLAAAGVDGFGTLDALDAAAAVERGCALGMRSGPFGDALALSSVVILDPWRELAG